MYNEGGVSTPGAKTISCRPGSQGYARARWGQAMGWWPLAQARVGQAGPCRFFLLLLPTGLELDHVARHSSASITVPSRARRVGGLVWSSCRGRRDDVEKKSEDTRQTSR